MALQLCDGCLRHVRSTETRCPFCDAQLTAKVLPVLTMPRASRAAQVALAASMIVGCREEPKPTADPTTTTAAPAISAASIPHSAEPVDATPEVEAPTPTPSVSVSASVSAPVHKSVPTATAPQPPPNLKKPYGAPPADGLLV